MDVALAVDVGASKFACGLVDARGSVILQRQVPVDRSLDADGLFGHLADLVRAVLRHAQVAELSVVVCGVGAPGPITANLERITPVNLTIWREFPLRERLASVVQVPVAGDVDTKALAIGEGWVGGAVGIANYLAMVVSTGIGGGVVLDGRLLQGESANAGHVGHIIVVPDGRQCGCRARGCLEAEASGRAIEAMTGRPATDASAAIVERTGRLVGRAVASVVNLLDLSLVLVAGSVALGFGEPFFAAAQAELDTSCRLGGASRPVIRAAGLGEESPLVGAAGVGWRALGRVRFPGR